MPLTELLTSFLLYVLIPVWLLAGFGDWLCHRAWGMSETAGAKESIIHLLMLFEIGLPLLAGLLFEINALVIALMIAGLAAHELTGIWDLHYAHSKRDIRPLEQHVHSFQEIIPYMAFAVVAILHWDQFIALIGMSEAAAFTLEWKRNPLPVSYVATVIVLSVVFELIPFTEELFRSYRRGGRKLVPRSEHMRDLTGEDA